MLGSGINAMKKKNSGQAVVELAFVLPVLILLVAGILEFGLFFNSYLNVAFASKEGARIASLDTNATDQTVTAAVTATVPFSSSATVTVSPAVPRVTGSPVTVTVSTTYTFITPVISALVPSNPYTISSSTVMRSE